MPRLKPGTILPSEEEDAAITAAALSDADTRPLTDEEWERIKPNTRRVFSRDERHQVTTTIRFDADVLSAIQATGPGWRSRINDIVRDYIKSHRLSN